MGAASCGEDAPGPATSCSATSCSDRRATRTAGPPRRHLRGAHPAVGQPCAGAAHGLAHLAMLLLYDEATCGHQQPFLPLPTARRQSTPQPQPQPQSQQQQRQPPPGSDALLCGVGAVAGRLAAAAAGRGRQRQASAAAARVHPVRMPVQPGVLTPARAAPEADTLEPEQRRLVA
eukprot:scaffold135017_cov51-Phaeocystis_antarctica.AAC.2